MFPDSGSAHRSLHCKNMHETGACIKLRWKDKSVSGTDIQMPNASHQSPTREAGQHLTVREGKRTLAPKFHEPTQHICFREIVVHLIFHDEIIFSADAGLFMSCFLHHQGGGVGGMFPLMLYPLEKSVE